MTEAPTSRGPEREPLDVLDAIYSTRAMRHLKPDPIPDDVLWAILDAAIRGPSGGNSQGWGFVVVRDPEVKAKIAEWYLEGWNRSYASRKDEVLSAQGGLGQANYNSADHLANHIAEAPAWVFPVLRGAAQRESALTGSSIYGVVQNLMLAARAYGIGSTLTSLYMGHEAEVRELLGLPEDARTMALIPLGYPARGRFSEPRRRPVEEVTHWERWGETRERE